MSLELKKGTEILCLRFVNVGGYDCIEEHTKVLDNLGYVWFGKIGNKPMQKLLDKMIEDKSNYILLKDPNYSYICEFESYSVEEQEVGKYPDYYRTEIMTNREFSIWFKLISVKKVLDTNVLSKVVLKSSRSPILITTKKSMASHFYTVVKEDIEFV